MQTIRFKLNTETKLPLQMIKDAPRKGKFDDYADYLLSIYNIEVSLQDSIDYLKTHGFRDTTELLDLETNKKYLLWLSCLDCQYNDTQYFYMGS